MRHKYPCLSVLMHIPPFLHPCQVLSGSEWGNMLVWEGGLIKVELCRAARKSCHQGPINQIVLDEGEVITIGADGCIRVSFLDAWSGAPTSKTYRSPYWCYQIFTSHKVHFIKDICGHLLLRPAHLKSYFPCGKYLNSSQN